MRHGWVLCRPFRGECYEKESDTTFVFELYYVNRVRYNVEDNRVNKAFRQYCNVNEHAAKVEQLVRQSMRNIIVRRARQIYGRSRRPIRRGTARDGRQL